MWTHTLYPVAGPLDRDRVVEILGVSAVDRHRREVAEVPALAGLPARDGLSLLFHLLGKRTGGPDGGEKRLVDVARVFGGPDDARHLAAQRAVLLARVHQHDIPRLGTATKLACDQHRTPLLHEERICYRVLPPTDQHGRQYQESAPIKGVW